METIFDLDNENKVNNQIEETNRTLVVSELYQRCKRLCLFRPSCEELKALPADEANFYVMLADYFLQQKQRDLIEQGIF